MKQNYSRVYGVGSAPEKLSDNGNQEKWKHFNATPFSLEPCWETVWCRWQKWLQATTYLNNDTEFSEDMGKMVQRTINYNRDGARSFWIQSLDAETDDPWSVKLRREILCSRMLPSNSFPWRTVRHPKLATRSRITLSQADHQEMFGIINAARNSANANRK